MFIVIAAVSAFAQVADTAYVEFRVNVNATVTATQSGNSATVSMPITANQDKTLAIPLSGTNSVWHTGGALERLNAPAVSNSRGNITLRLPAQAYQNAEIALHTVSGKRVLRGKAAASEATSAISRKNIAAGVYLLSVKGINGSAFTMRLTHRGGNMNINAVFGGENASSERRLAKAAAEDWTIKVSASGYVDSTYTLNLVSGTGNAKQVITLTANTVAYTVIFDANGGSVSPASGTTGASGTLASLPIPTRTGYTFNGWFTAATGGTAVTTGTVFNAITTIYAQWATGAVPTYTITFNANEGSVSPASGTTGASGTLASLPIPTRTGYTFNGWFTAATGGDEVTVSNVYSANTTIYAQWTASGGGSPDLIYGGQTYKTVVINGKTWMAENLNYTTASGSACYGEEGGPMYDNETGNYRTLTSSEIQANCEKYGRLYNWATAMNLPSSYNSSSAADQIQTPHQGVCSVNWHLPSDAEWTQLTDFVGSNAGTKLKSSLYWNSYSGIPAGTDDYGFSAWPGGGNSDGSMGYTGDYGHWWSATEYDGAADLFAFHRGMSYNNKDVVRYKNGKSFLFSVRCVQDY